MSDPRCPLCGAALTLLPDNPHSDQPVYRCDAGHFTHVFATGREDFERPPAEATVYKKT